MYRLGWLALVVVGAIGCSATVIDDDGDGLDGGGAGTTNWGEGGFSNCWDVNPDCEPCPEEPPASADWCVLGMECAYPVDGLGDCFDVYVCESGEDSPGAQWVLDHVEGTCQSPCEAPSCDAGDQLIIGSTCPAAAPSCYEVWTEGECATAVLCADIAQPTHICEGTESEGVCGYEGSVCTHQLSAECVSFYECVNGNWLATRSACKDGG